ncbi:MAG TPA: response regulator [Methylomirabilota bacterium]|nr:response regulator [Methylomirabilota bacterium]
MLLVEDDLDQAEMVARTLRRQDGPFEVTAVADGSACLHALTQHTYELVLLDYSLPRMNGLEVLAEIRRRGASVPVVMVTGQGDERVAVEAMRTGAADYVIKSGGYLTTLPTVIRKVLKQHELAGENARLYAQTQQTLAELQARQAHLEALLTVNRELSRIQPVESLLARIAEACGRLFVASSVGFRLVEGEELMLCGTWGPTHAFMTKPLQVGESLAGIVAARGEALVVQDPLSDPRLLPAHRVAYQQLDVRAFLGVPLKIADQVIGVLTVRTSHAEGFSTAEVEIAQGFASQAAIALENSRLYQETQRALAELTATKEQLVQAQKMEAIGQLAGGVAHDFNNLLMVISGRSRLYLLRAPADDPGRRDIELIDETVDRAAALTRQLLAFSRKQLLKPTVLDLNALVGELAPMLRRLIGEHIEMAIRPGSQTGSVMADRGQLEQVIMNLVVNARDAMPDGGTVTIATEGRDLREMLAHRQERIPAGPYVTLTVEDSGCGMDATTLRKIFEPFFTTKGLGQGTGLGLSTVDGIVHQSGGFIGVDSTLGRGTTFTIYLPRTTAVAEEPAILERPAALARGDETVLLVEDEPEVRHLTREILTGCGYTVLDTGDPRDALAMSEQHRGPLHLLLTDMVMPGMRGHTLAAQVLGQHPDVRVVYMSGYAESIVTAQGVIEPAGVFLQKPVTPDALVYTVREVLDGAGSTRRNGLRSHSVGARAAPHGHRAPGSGARA